MLLFCTVLLYWVEQCRTRWRELVTYTTSFAAVVSMAIVSTVRFVFTTVCESLCRWWFCGLQHLMDAFKRHRFILMPGTANAALWKIRFFHGGGGCRVRGGHGLMEESARKQQPATGRLWERGIAHACAVCWTLEGGCSGKPIDEAFNLSVL